MKYNADSEEYTLSSGLTFYASGGILGIAYDDGARVAFQGYDAMLSTDSRPFTDAERAEIATHMIDLWAKWGGMTFFSMPPVTCK